jgi:hypothetical protein
MLLTGLTLAGCGGSGSDQPIAQDPPAVAGMLRPVRSAGELEILLKASLGEAVAAGVPGVVALPAADSFSRTYTVDQGIDEFDIARYDGSHLYVAPTWQYSGQGGSIRILRTNAATGDVTQVALLPVPASQNVQGMYVANGRLVVLASEAYFGPFGDVWPAIVLWAPTRLSVHVFDIANPARPTPVMSADIRGVFVASRRIGNQVVLVTRHTPRALIDADARARLASLTLAELLPSVTMDGRTQPLVDARNCYVSSDTASGTVGHATLTTITTFSLDNPRELTSTCYDEEANGVYASQTALYVSQPRAADGASPATRIHKFSPTGAPPRYVGSVEVPGLVWTGGQEDFRMSERDGLLRVMTTTWTQDADDALDHQLFVLREKTTGPALEIAARLPNAARPQEIGKPDEALFAVRFAGDRAYAVTFRRVDPLYVIDLSTPADPRIAGELQIPGNSDLLHPVSDDLLLGIGSDTNRVKLELFDVSMPGAPQSRGWLLVDGVTSWSELSWDHRALAYLPGASADRFALPATSTYPTLAPPLHVQTALFQYEIIGKQTAASASLQAAGGVLPPPDPDREGNYALTNRAFVDGDTVIYVRDGQVWSSSWHTPSQVRGPF